MWYFETYGCCVKAPLLEKDWCSESLNGHAAQTGLGRFNQFWIAYPEDEFLDDPGEACGFVSELGHLWKSRLMVWKTRPEKKRLAVVAQETDWPIGWDFLEDSWPDAGARVAIRDLRCFQVSMRVFQLRVEWRLTLRTQLSAPLAKMRGLWCTSRKELCEKPEE